MHLILDARCKFGMNGVREVGDFILDVVRLADLRLRHLHVQEFHTGDPPGPGVSGVALLSDSHLNIHTWPEHQTVQICLHSCKGFDPGAVRRLVDRHFGLAEVLAERCFERPLGAGVQEA